MPWSVPGERGGPARTEAVEPEALNESVADCTMRPAGDVTGDGQTDLVFNCAEQGEFGRVRLAIFDSGGGDSAAVFVGVEGTADFPIGPVSGSAGDADGDGLGDVGIGGGRDNGNSLDHTHADGLYVVPGAQLRGAITLDASLRFVADKYVADFALCDFDGDGLQDLMVGEYGGAGLIPYADILP